MSYTNIPKPSSTAYSFNNPVGKQQYDEPSLTYDDVLTFYDGANLGAYTNVNKPSSTTYTKIVKPT